MSGRSRGTTAAVFALVAVVHLAITLPALSPAPHNGGDNAGYLALAHSLATDARYVELWDPAGAPHTKYPPLYPALLAGAMLLGAEAWITFKLLSVLLVTTAVVVSFGWVRDRHGPGLALGVALVLALSPAFLWSSNWILSDPLFLALTLGCLWAFQRSEGLERAGPWLVAGCLAAILATFTRTAGLPLILAVGGAFALERRWRALGGFSAAFLVPSLLWWLRSRSSGQVQYVSEFWMIDPYRPELGTAGMTDLLRRMLENLEGYVFRFVPGGVTQGPDGALAAFGVVLVGAAIVGWALRARRKLTVAELFTPLYLGLILLWPAVWSGDRFALPLYPLLLFYAGEALLAGAGRVHARAPVAVGLVAVLALALPSSRAWGDSVRQAAACRRAVRAGGPFACYGEGFQQFVAAARWLGENAPDGVGVFSRKPRIFYTLSGVKSRTYPLSPDPDLFFRQAREAGVTYVVLDRVDRLGTAYVGAVVQARPEAFCGLVGVGRGEVLTQILGILDESERAAPDATAGATEGVRIAPCPDRMKRGQPRSLPPYSAARLPLLALPSP